VNGTGSRRLNIRNYPVSLIVCPGPIQSNALRRTRKAFLRKQPYIGYMAVDGGSTDETTGVVVGEKRRPTSSPRIQRRGDHAIGDGHLALPEWDDLNANALMIV
jgi:hypothetical protein